MGRILIYEDPKEHQMQLFKNNKRVQGDGSLVKGTSCSSRKRSFLPSSPAWSFTITCISRRSNDTYTRLYINTQIPITKTNKLIIRLNKATLTALL